MSGDRSPSAMGQPSTRPPRRFIVDGAVLLTAALVVAVSIVLTCNPPASWEADMFHALNSLPDVVEWVLWPIQQAGMVLAIPIGAVVLWRFVHDWRLPLAFLVGGGAFGWGGAKVIKELVGRGRPAALLDDVQLGFDSPTTGLGFPSGHAVVVAVMAVVLAPYVSLRMRWVLVGLVPLTCLARVVIGAHLPLDVIAGAAFGVVIGSSVNLSVGVGRSVRERGRENAP